MTPKNNIDDINAFINSSINRIITIGNRCTTKNDNQRKSQYLERTTRTHSNRKNTFKSGGSI